MKYPGIFAYSSKINNISVSIYSFFYDEISLAWNILFSENFSLEI